MAILKDIAQAASLLKEGGVVGMPTETVYGLAGNALDVQAVARIFEAKNRPSFDPLIVHVAHVDAAAQVGQLNATAKALLKAFSPGPITVIVPKNSSIPDLVTSGHPTVGIRIPNHPTALALLDQLDFPLAAPSANPFGYTSPTTAEHVEEQLGNAIAGVLDGGPCAVGLESTIVDCTAEQPVVLRLGGVPREAIEAELGARVKTKTSSSNPTAPGMLSSHYNPGVPVRLFEDRAALEAELSKDAAGVGVLYAGSELPHQPALNLSASGNLAEVAAKLFGALRSIKKEKITRIYVHKVQEEGLGRAINDRLLRASVQ